MRFRAFASAALVLVGVQVASSQVLVTTGGDYAIFTKAQAVSVVDEENYAGHAVGAAFSKSADSYAEFDDPTFGLHTAHGAAGLNWETATVGGTTTLHGFVGGLAEATSNGLDTYALGSASVSVYFDIATDSTALLRSEGTFNSDLYRFDGSTWQPFETGINASLTDVFMPVGSYRWDSGAGGAVTGFNFSSAGIEFWVEAQAVPEPTALAAFGLGTLALLKRRRKSYARSRPLGIDPLCRFAEEVVS